MVPKGCVRFTFQANVFPRFAQYQRRLASILPRFENILDSAQLWSCISQGKVKLKEIKGFAKPLTDQVKVMVVGGDEVTEDAVAWGGHLSVWKVERLAAKRETVNWGRALAELKCSTKFDSYFMVYLMDSPTQEMINDLGSQFSDVKSDQLCNIIIYDTATKHCLRYVDLLSVVGATATATSIESVQSKEVSQLIQYTLEDRAVELLEMIVNYANNFVPKPTTEPNKSLLNECSTQVLESLNSASIIDDLDPEKGVYLELDSMETDTSSSPGTSMAMDVEDSSPTTSMQSTDSMTSLKSPVKDKNTIFVEKFMNFLCKKTKCILCDHLSKKYGISSSLLNEFMNEPYYDYETKYRKACADARVPQWSEMKQGRRAATMLNYSFITRQSSCFHDSEEYVKEKLVVLNEMMKLAYELHALLRVTVVPVNVTVPTYPRLKPDMQNALLELDEIHGCGTVYGKLTLQVKTDLTPSATQTVRDILDHYKYPHGFTVRLVAEAVRHAGATSPKAEVGNELKATLNDATYQQLKQENDQKVPKVNTSKEKSGSLGCFLKLSKKKDKPGMGHLYCVTCAHCVTDCHENVKVRIGNSLNDLGTRENLIEDGERLDIAVIRVNEDQVKNCQTCICVFNREWQLYEGEAGDLDLQGKTVNKRGFQTGETTGLVSCNDYRMQRWNQGTRGTNFNDVYNILVDALPGSKPGEEFSRSGDSGSAVYYHKLSRDGTNNPVMVVSLVQGSMTNNRVYQCTYTCHMKRGIQELCERFGYQLEFPAGSGAG